MKYKKEIWFLINNLILPSKSRGRVELKFTYLPSQDCMQDVNQSSESGEYDSRKKYLKYLEDVCLGYELITCF